MITLLRRWLAPDGSPTVEATYIALVDAARNPFFYTGLSVPDTLDGRFEMIVLHLFLLEHRLVMGADADAESRAFAQALSEHFIADMDRSIREIGVADTGVHRRIGAMGKAYHGRLQAYTASLAEDDALRAALARNVYGTVAEGEVAHLRRLAEYTRAMVQALAETPMHEVVRGMYRWPAPECG